MHSDTLKSMGADIKFVVYEDAMHGFDTESSRTYASGAQTWIHCPSTQINMDRAATHSQGAATRAPCMSIGIAVGGDTVYREKSRIEVKSIIIQNVELVAQ